MQTRAHRFALLPLAFVLVLSGCRMYGSYGNEEALRQSILDANRVFSAELERNRADAATLPASAALREAFAETVSLQEAFAAHHAETAQELENSGDYRKLNRAYGAIVAEHELIRERFAALADWASQGDSLSYTQAAARMARYMVIPPAYARTTNQLYTPSIAEVMRGASTLTPAGPGVDSVAAVTAAPVDTLAADTVAIQQ